MQENLFENFMELDLDEAASLAGGYVIPWYEISKEVREKDEREMKMYIQNRKKEKSQSF
ncbi:MAG: hypothetical protein IKU28_02665 [Erysipelotrichaceae bacterium]|nr:hypothetical protein [Erysipelotrichaceae bacterium]